MLIDQIKKEQVAAMKASQPLRLSVIRMLLSAVAYKKIELQHDLADEEVLAVINSEAKKRREAIASYQAAHREAQVAQEQQELEILQAYLPAQLSEEEIQTELGKMQLPPDFGQAMKIVAPIFKGKADGSMVAKLVKEILDARS